jgi:lipopolysaccharide export system ATP-binding protein
MVAGLLPPDSGSIRLGAKDLGSLPLYRRAQLGLGYLPQESTVFRGLSVLDNFIAVLEAQGLDRKTCRARAEEIVRAYNLDCRAASDGVSKWRAP